MLGKKSPGDVSGLSMRRGGLRIGWTTKVCVCGIRFVTLTLYKLSTGRRGEVGKGKMQSPLGWRLWGWSLVFSTLTTTPWLVLRSVT